MDEVKDDSTTMETIHSVGWRGLVVKVVFLITAPDVDLDLAVVDEAAAQGCVDDGGVLRPTALDRPRVPLRHEHGSRDGFESIIDVTRAVPRQMIRGRWWVSTRRVQAVQMPVKAAAFFVALDDSTSTARRFVAMETDNWIVLLVDNPSVIWWLWITSAVFPGRG